MSELSYREFLEVACGNALTPYPYQERLASEEPLPELPVKVRAALSLNWKGAA